MTFCESLKRIPRFVLIIAVISGLIVVVLSKKSSSKTRDGCDLEDDADKKTISGDNLLNYLSTKRPYDDDDKDKNKKAKKGKTSNGEDCTPIKLWYFGRHGTRNPGKKDTAKMISMLPSLKNDIIDAYEECRGTLTKKQIKKLREWQLPDHVKMDNESFLVKQGMKELRGIGKRYRKLFPSLFSSMDSKNVIFRSTSTQRTVASALAFATGSFDLKDVPEELLREPLKSDPVLKFYETCTKWMKEVDDNPQSTPELSKFEKSDIVNSTLSRVSERLGFNTTLTLDNVTLIYTTCGFETAWNDEKPSPWCAAFEEKDLMVMAYREDLEYYWKDGYGYSINYEQACTPLQDMLQFFRNTTTSEKVRAYFSHSGATLKILARLGMYKDSEPLKSDTFDQIKKSYKWRTSLIDTMGTNLAFALYKCKDDDQDQVEFFFQEKSTQIPSCGNQISCPFDSFYNNLSSLIGECDLKAICDL